MPVQKDEVLDTLATHGNVAQFVAFRPSHLGVPKQSFSRVAGHASNYRFSNAFEAVNALLARGGEGKVNVRSYLPEDPRSKEFVYALSTVDSVLSAVTRLTREGLSTIVNETIDVSDGGVSGVLQSNTLEFSPDDTPRCVEKPGVLSMSFQQGMVLLKTVYGFRPDLEASISERTEFSIHPRARGWKETHTLLWEREENNAAPATPTLRWPNNFSRLLGDKAFGLLVADGLGVPVPRTIVVSRRLGPFIFGRETGSSEVWTRTCPREPQPGLYTTVKGWLDPFSLLAREDPSGGDISSVLRQDAVNAAWSGAAIAAAGEGVAIEGVQGEGDRLMLGLDRPQRLPTAILADVELMYQHLVGKLGPVRIEWVHDGKRTWCVQLHVGTTQTSDSTIVPGDVDEWWEIRADIGLPAIRERLNLLPKGAGVLLVGGVGVTSHIADLLRKKGCPSRVVAAD
ncbi:MAG: hypothetical protein RID42_17870 [Alphaproteobacteria bacterium]